MEIHLLNPNPMRFRQSWLSAFPFPPMRRTVSSQERMLSNTLINYFQISLRRFLSLSSLSVYLYFSQAVIFTLEPFVFNRFPLSNMSNSSSVQGDLVRDGDREPPRKRVRKGTKSCWECKRRKIRCQLSTEDVAVCSGCRSRGSTCLSQEYPEEHDSSGGTNVGERLGRVELLLEKLVAKISSFEEEENSHKIATPESMGSNDVLEPYARNIAVTNLRDSVPILSLFDSEVVSHNCHSRVL